MNQSTDQVRMPIFGESRSTSDSQIESRLSDIQKLTSNQNEQLFQQQRQLDGLARGFLDIVQVLQQKGDSVKAIETTNQNVITLGEGLVKLSRQLREADFGQGITDIKYRQQNISEAVINAHETLDKQAESLSGYLGWKRVVMIIISTAIITSLCNVAIASLTPWALSQVTEKSQPKNDKKPLPKVKKYKGDRSK